MLLTVSDGRTLRLESISSVVDQSRKQIGRAGQFENVSLFTPKRHTLCTVSRTKRVNSLYGRRRRRRRWHTSM